MLATYDQFAAQVYPCKAFVPATLGAPYYLDSVRSTAPVPRRALARRGLFGRSRVTWQLGINFNMQGQL